MTIKDLIELSSFPYDDIRIDVKGIDEFEAIYYYDGYNMSIPPELLAKNVCSYSVKAFTKQVSMCEINLVYGIFIQIDT